MLDRALSRGAGVAFITQVSAVGLGYLTHVLLARLMGVTEYGVYVYALAWATPLAALGGLGVHMVALRFVPAYATSKAYGLIRGSYRAGANVAFTGGLAVSVMALGVLGFIQNDVRPLV
ncbi:MAG: oligosaccharide flippase family protein, partial [Rhodothermales bacterium]